MISRLRQLLISGCCFLLVLLLQGCFGSGGGGTTGGVNTAPVISATPVNIINVGSAYSFNVTVTDPDQSDTLTFSLVNKPAWMTITQTGSRTAVVGGNPTLSDVGTYNSIGISVTDSSGGGDVLYFNVTVTNCSSGGGANVTIDGTITFDRVNYNVPSGLDYTNITSLPARGVVVEAICGAVIDTIVTDASGYYSLSVPGGTTQMFVRVKAQMLPPAGASGSWNFRVVDNTSSGALYSMDSSVFDSGITNTTRDLHADDGWTGTNYGNPRVAAPFAILDSVYKAMDKILAVDSNAVFPALDINWSVKNIALSGDPAFGRIETSHYNGTAIYLLGYEDSDTDEYDEHVIIHEFGHYYEDKFSRSDSIGGPHWLDGLLDIRVAFSEGFGNAYAAMMLDNEVYKDAMGTDQSVLTGFNIETYDCGTNAVSGWFSECSVQSILYDLYDANNDGETINMGFAPIHTVMTSANQHKDTTALTSLFSFIHHLKASYAASAAAIDTLAGAQSIDPVTDVYGTGESNNASGASVLPVYDDIAVGQTVNVCSTGEYQAYNGVGVYRFLKFTPSSSSATITAVRTSGISSSDPDIELYYKGQLIDYAWSVTSNSETLNVSGLNIGQEYIIQVNEDDYYNAGYSGTGSTCFNVTVN